MCIKVPAYIPSSLCFIQFPAFISPQLCSVIPEYGVTFHEYSLGIFWPQAERWLTVSTMAASPSHIANGRSTETAVPIPQSAQNPTQSSGLRIVQEGSTYDGSITATGASSVRTGNHVERIQSGEVNQKGSKYADIRTEDEGNVGTGNYVNGEKSG